MITDAKTLAKTNGESFWAKKESKEVMVCQWYIMFWFAGSLVRSSTGLQRKRTNRETCVYWCVLWSYRSWGCLAFWSQQAHCHICLHTNIGRCCCDTGLVWSTPPRYNEEYRSLKRGRGGEKKEGSRGKKEMVKKIEFDKKTGLSLISLRQRCPVVVIKVPMYSQRDINNQLLLWRLQDSNHTSCLKGSSHCQ